MKFCPFCGADLLKENVVFCMECGARLSEEEKREKNQKASGGRHSVVEKKNQIKVAQAEDNISVNDGYDGYYDDVLPPDYDREKQELNKGLARKIVALGGGVFFVIAICVVILYLL